MDSHRSYAPDELDGPGHQPERGNSGPDWDRPGSEVGYASVPVDPSSGAGYAAPTAYASPAQQYGFDPVYRDHSQPAEPQAGYGSAAGQAGYPGAAGQAGYAAAESQVGYAADSGIGYAADSGVGYATVDPGSGYAPVGSGGGYRSADGQSLYGALADTGSARAADGATAVARPGGARPGEQPSAVAPQSPPVPPGFVPEPTPAPQSPPASGMVHTAPTTGLPFVSGEGSAAAGRSPVAGEARTGGSNAGWSASGRDEETQVVRHSTEPLDRAALRRPPADPGRPADGVYRSRRPGTAVAIAVVTVVFELIALRLLAAAFLASTVQVGGSIASSFLVIGLPMFGLGLYGLLSGAAAAPGAGTRAWLRAPLVYLPVGLVLFVCAGLAAA